MVKIVVIVASVGWVETQQLLKIRKTCWVYNPTSQRPSEIAFQTAFCNPNHTFRLPPAQSSLKSSLLRRRHSRAGGNLGSAAAISK